MFAIFQWVLLRIALLLLRLAGRILVLLTLLPLLLVLLVLLIFLVLLVLLALLPLLRFPLARRIHRRTVGYRIFHARV